jgi:hypothetical protein
VVELVGGEAIETAMIGRDGAFGASQALDGKLSLNHVVMQVPGAASVIESSRLCELALQMTSLRKLLVEYDQFLLAQVQQAVACNAVHDIHKRMCKWLVRMQRLVGNDLPLTQEFLAQMMGVQRTSVSTIAGSLQKLGMITYSRGHIHINDIGMVRQHACECDDTIQSHYLRYFQQGPTSVVANCPDQGGVRAQANLGTFAHHRNWSFLAARKTMRLVAIILSVLLGSHAFAIAQGAPSGRGSTTGDPASSSANPRAEPGGTTGSRASNPSGSGTSTSGGRDENADQGRDRMPESNMGVKPMDQQSPKPK